MLNGAQPITEQCGGRKRSTGRALGTTKLGHVERGGGDREKKSERVLCPWLLGEVQGTLRNTLKKKADQSLSNARADFAVQV